MKKKKAKLSFEFYDFTDKKKSTIRSLKLTYSHVSEQSSIFIYTQMIFSK